MRAFYYRYFYPPEDYVKRYSLSKNNVTAIMHTLDYYSVYFILYTYFAINRLRYRSSVHI